MAALGGRAINRTAQKRRSVPLVSTAGGKWNTFEITAKGRDTTVVLNGKKTAEIHNGLFTEGPFALQHGAGVMKFRKVAVKPL